MSLQPRADLMFLLWLVLIGATSVTPYPEYRSLIPNGFNVTFQAGAWPGVGHVTRHGGGPLNRFGLDFAAANHRWTKELCGKDSDGDGFTNGFELGDPDCSWVLSYNQSRQAFVSHPGLLSNSTSEETEIEYGKERSMQGDREQTWCADRSAIGQGPTAFLNFTIPSQILLGGQDVYTCHKFSLDGDRVSGLQDVVMASLHQQNQQHLHLHHVFLMECDSDSWFLDDMVNQPFSCMAHTASLYGTCRRWYLGNEQVGFVDYEACAPPGQVFGRVQEIVQARKHILLQIHWLLGDSQPVIETGPVQLALGLAQHNPQLGLVGHFAATALYSPSVLGGANSIHLLPGRRSTTLSYQCSSRCSYVPLGGSLQPKPVKMVAYSFHMHNRGVNMTVHLRRCKSRHQNKDMTWKVVGYNQAALHPVWQMKKPVQVFPGDWFEWTCAFDTSDANYTITGGYDYKKNEMCIFNVVYEENNQKFRACGAAAKEQGGDSVCSYEVTTMIQEAGKLHTSDFPIRHILDTKTTHIPRAQPVAWKAGILLMMLSACLLLMWLTHAILTQKPLPYSRLELLGSIQATYQHLAPHHQRNVCVYVMHLILDTAALVLMSIPLAEAWCACSDISANWGAVQLGLVYMVASYFTELCWRNVVDSLLLVHHITTLVVIVLLGMEFIYLVVRVPSTLLVLALFAMTEHPTYVALLVHRFLPGTRHVMRAWLVAFWCWVTLKGGSVVLAVYVCVTDWHNMPTWVKVVYVLVWALLGSVQGKTAAIHWALYKKATRGVAANATSKGRGMVGDDKTGSV